MQTEQRKGREYVGADVLCRKDVTMRPKSIVRKDGKRQSVEQVLEVYPVCMGEENEPVDRYAVVIDGARKNIFFEHNTDENELSIGRWFVEREE